MRERADPEFPDIRLHNHLIVDVREDLTRRYEELCGHKGKIPTCNNTGDRYMRFAHLSIICCAAGVCYSAAVLCLSRGTARNRRAVMGRAEQSDPQPLNERPIHLSASRG